MAVNVDKKLQEVEEELELVEQEIETLLERRATLQEQREKLQNQVQLDKRAPKADWQKTNFAWSAQLLDVLKDTFGLQGFRPLQQEIIIATLQGRDVLCLLPSGGGKSLCYQLPALIRPGLSLVVSPLLSLIQDQVLGLAATGVPACSLTSLTPKEEVNSIYERMQSGEVRLMYVTPERIASSKRFMSKLEKLYQAGKLARIAIDEAHCCSQWGNDFRPDYRKLGILRQQFPNTPILALTATATAQVCMDVKSILNIDGCEFFRSSINRPNLMYSLMHKPADPSAAIVDWIQQHYPNGETGIVYCLTRKETEQVALELNAAGIGANCYHADMDPAARQSSHEHWSKGGSQVMVCTVAFGMGINKPDVRWVIHHSLSKSVENYYQESSRAGRDSLPARCLLMYRFSDTLRQASIVCTEPGWQTNLLAMLRYALAVGTCRRGLLQRHFGEAPAECRCMCDGCVAADGGRLTKVDITEHAKAVVGVLQGKKATLVQLVQMWRSAAAGKVAQQLARAGSKEDNEAVIAQLLSQGLLELELAFTAYATNAYLKPSGLGLQLAAAGKRGVWMDALMPNQQDGEADPEPQLQPVVEEQQQQQQQQQHGPLRQRLEALRDRLAAAQRVFPHSVLSSQQLQALIMQPPQLQPQLQTVLGAAKMKLYGNDIWAALQWNQHGGGGTGDDEAPATASSGGSPPADAAPASQTAVAGPSGQHRDAGQRIAAAPHVGQPGTSTCSRPRDPGQGSGRKGAAAARLQQDVVVIDSTDDDDEDDDGDFMAPRKRTKR